MPWRSVEHLELNVRNIPSLGAQMCFKAGQQVAHFTGGGVVLDDQAPSAAFNGAWSHAVTQAWREQGFNGLHACIGFAKTGLLVPARWLNDGAVA